MIFISGGFVGAEIARLFAGRGGEENPAEKKQDVKDQPDKAVRNTEKPVRGWIDAHENAHEQAK